MKLEELLNDREAVAPPDDLLEKIKGEIPRELPQPLAFRTRPTAILPIWMKAAAALFVAGVAGLIGYRMTEFRKVSQISPPFDLRPLSRPQVEARPRPKPPEPPKGAALTVPIPRSRPSSIQVTTRDEGGAALPGVKVRVRGEGVDKLATTDAEGRAKVEVPKEGTYRVETELSGFEKKVGEAQVARGKTNEIDAKMKLDAVAQTVIVSGGAPTSTAAMAAPEAVAPPPPPAKRTVDVLHATLPALNSPAPSAMAPSTGGEREPNDGAYGLTFFKEYGTNPFVDTDDDKLSTFGLDVDTGSYTVARRYLTDGNLPPREAIRVEEFINAFSYGDRPPARGDFALRAEAAPTPFMKGDLYRIVRFSIRGRVVDPRDRKPAVLTFVVDVSGSMNIENRLQLVKKALGLLLDQLRPSDEVGLVIYGSTAQKILEPTSDKEAIRQAIARLVSEGSTNAEDGIRMGYDMAARNRRRDRVNRVILCSDGVANVGRTGPESIFSVIEREAKQNDIELTTVGFGMGNYNDVLMEQLANKGDGRYAYVDTLEEARRIFVEELTGTIQTIATDAKAQVEFDPAVVARWRLIGYENRDIADEKFRDDTVDAGEIGAGHSVTALYEIKLQPSAPARGTAATLHLRYRSKETGRVVEIEHDLTTSDFSRSWEAAPRGLKLAALVAEFAELLKGDYWAKDGDIADVANRARSLSETSADERVSELVRLIERAEQVGVGKSKRQPVAD